MEKSPIQKVYDFCKANGICTQCFVKWSGTDTLKCDSCRESNNASRRRSYAKHRFGTGTIKGKK